MLLMPLHLFDNFKHASYASSILLITHEFIHEIDRLDTPFPPYVALLSAHALVLAGIDPGNQSIPSIISYGTPLSSSLYFFFL